MHTLRAARQITRFVLVWFVLALGVAIASPVVKPQASVLVCSAIGGVKLLVTGDDDGGPHAGGHTLDCPLCASLAAPPPATRLRLDLPSPLAHVLRPIPAAQLAVLTRAPLPPRGPPHHA